MADLLDFLLRCATVFAGQVTAIFLHEAGHILVAWMCGWHPFKMKVGSGPTLVSFKIGDLQFDWTAVPLTGLAYAYPKTTRHFRWTSAAFALAGPLATVGCLWAIWALFSLSWRLPEWLSFGIGAAGFLQLSMLIGSLMPRSVRVDGMTLPNDMLQVVNSLTAKSARLKDDAASYIMWGAAVLLDRGEVKRAQALVENAVVKDKGGLVWARMTWINLLLLRGKADLARKEQAAASEDWKALGASRVEVLDALACFPLYFGGMEMLEDALRFSDAAIAEAPEKITLKGTKSALLIEAGRSDEGWQLLQEVAAKTQSETDRAFCRYYAALAQLKMGDRTKAQALLREATEEYPQFVIRARIEHLIGNAPE